MKRAIVVLGILTLLAGVVLWLFPSFLATVLGREYPYRYYGFGLSLAGIVVLVIGLAVHGGGGDPTSPESSHGGGGTPTYPESEHGGGEPTSPEAKR